MQWLKYTKKLKGVILIHAKTPKRQEIVNNFQGQLDKEGNLIVNEGEPMILISTPKLVGLGLTLTRAFRLVLLEPAYVARDESQAYARIKIISQENPKTFTFRLFTKGSTLERNIKILQNRRMNLGDMSFKEAGDGMEFGEKPPEGHVASVDWGSQNKSKAKSKKPREKFPY